MNPDEEIKVAEEVGRLYQDQPASLGVNGYDALADLEYSLYKYYQRNYAPIVASSYNASSRSGDTESIHGVLLESVQRFYGNAAVQHDLMLFKEAARGSLVSYLGQERYDVLSEKVGGDLAEIYVCSRFSAYSKDTLGGLCRKSGRDFVFSESLRRNDVVTLYNEVFSDSTSAKARVAEDVRELSYRSSSNADLENYSAAGAGLTNLAVCPNLVGLGFFLYDLSFNRNNHSDTTEEQINREIFGDRLRPSAAGDPFSNVRSDNYNNNRQTVTYLNSHLVKPFQDADQDIVKVARDNLHVFNERFAATDGHSISSYIKEHFGDTCSLQEGALASWTRPMSDKELYDESLLFLSIAEECKRRDTFFATIDGRVWNMADITDRAYSCSRVLAYRQGVALDLSEGEVYERASKVLDGSFQGVKDVTSQLHDQVSVHYALNGQFGVKGEEKKEQYNVEKEKKSKMTSVDVSKQSTSGWGSMLDAVGLSGFGTVGKNLGYVLAMLPDMLIGMFTGKTRNLKFEDNMLPIASIVAGMFVKNPLLKMLLVGFGGANLLNKAGQEALENRDGIRKSSAVMFRKYDDEILDLRIKDPVLKGNTLLAGIDGVPCVITLNTEVIDAYEKGYLPLNTLSNAALRCYDEQQHALQQDYDRQVMAQDEGNERSVGIK